MPLHHYPHAPMPQGDAGHFYLFLDKSNPEKDTILIGQSS